MQTPSFCRVVAVASTALLLCAAAATAQLTNKPPDKQSTLIQNDGTGIRADDFASIISNKFFAGGTTNVRDAKFLFQQCYSGGMLNALQGALGGTNTSFNWVGGAASAWDEPSWGQGGVGTNRFDFWTHALLPQLSMTQSLLQAITNAIANDRARPGGGLVDVNTNAIAEHGQSVVGGAGANITLRDTNALSHHAILWAGSPDAARHFNDVNRVRTAITNAWGGTNANVTVTVLFGNGTNAPGIGNLPADWNALPATRSNLAAAINGLPLSTNEQFFFYASDHGGTMTDILPATNVPRTITPGFKDFEPFSLAYGELQGIQYGGTTLPTLDIDYFGVTLANTNAVFLNGNFLGYLDPAFTNMVFTVPVAALALGNIVEIDNNDLSAIDIRGKRFFTGAITTLEGVPEPATCSMLILGSGLLGLRRRRASGRARPAPP